MFWWDFKGNCLSIFMHKLIFVFMDISRGSALSLNIQVDIFVYHLFCKYQTYIAHYETNTKNIILLILQIWHLFITYFITYFVAHYIHFVFHIRTPRMFLYVSTWKSYNNFVWHFFVIYSVAYFRYIFRCVFSLRTSRFLHANTRTVIYNCNYNFLIPLS